MSDERKRLAATIRDVLARLEDALARFEVTEQCAASDVLTRTRLADLERRVEALEQPHP